MDLTLIKALFKLHLITPLGLIRLVYSFLCEGVTIMSILRFARFYYSDDVAVVSEGEKIKYKDLYLLAVRLSKILTNEYRISHGMRVGVMCRNHTISALLLPALSRLGVHIRLLNTDMMSEKIATLLKDMKMDFIISDDEFLDKFHFSQSSCKIISTESLRLNLTDSKYDSVGLPHVWRGGQIAVLTGGTSGNYKEASRKTGLVQFLPPFFALLKSIKIQDYKSVYVVLPFYHGFGLGVLIIALVMGKKICMSRHFHTEGALNLIAEKDVEVLPIVPTMLSRIWQTQESKSRMKSVKCIISGGDRLDKKLVVETHNNLGPVIFNLYGTSEAGFFMMATPADLDSNEETTLGKPITGVECEVREFRDGGIGTLWVRSKWAMIGFQNQWQSTGDLFYVNDRGYYFHCGIAKNMVVCGGENVYPESVELVINLHPEVAASKVFGTADPDFGTVLNAIVELKDGGTQMSELEFKEWLTTKLSRMEMPHKIEFRKLEVLSTGKRSGV